MRTIQYSLGVVLGAALGTLALISLARSFIWLLGVLA